MVIEMSQEDQNLNAFLSRVEDLYKPIVGGRPTVTGFERDFQELKRLSSGLKQSKEHTALAGQKPENKKKNRYKDITPFDFTRVKLTVTNDDPNSDYINASFIKGAEGHRNYIASQGPLPHTVLDFWQMLWQYNVAVIVMVCREIELGKKKCERYWADQEPKDFGGITVSLSDKQDLSDGYCQRTIKAQKGSEIRYIQQFHYTSWPDHGVPKLCSEIITLINHVRDVQSYSKDETAPLCVHCSAGCGRTGAVLAVDYVRNLLATKNVPPGLKTYDIIAEMRKQRPAIVQTKDQYEFVNTAVTEMFRIYMQTRTLSYKEFSVGYQGEQYVNINITGEEKSKDKRNGVGPHRPSTQLPSYENVELRNRPKISMSSLTKEAPKQGTLEEYPSNSPPPKPALRPVSTMLQENTSLGHTFGAFAGRKHSVPAVMSQLGGKKQNALAVTTPQKLAPPTPSAKPRGTNVNNVVSLLSPASRTRSASGSPMSTGKEGPKPPPPSGKPKLKPDPAPKNFTNAPPLKSPGNVAPISPLHGNAAPGLSSPNKAKSNFGLPLTPIYSNLDSPTKKEAPQPFVEPFSKNSKIKSPLHAKLQNFEKKSTTGGANAPTPKVSPQKSKPKEIVLKIREDNDAPSESETDSPAALNLNFVLPNTKTPKSPLLPSVSPKPKPAVKPSVLDLSNATRDFTPSSDANNGERKFLDGVLKNASGPKPQPMRQPSSPNLTNFGLPNSKKTGISSSVFDLSSESNKRVPPPVPQKTTIVRSSSVSGMNSEDGKAIISFHARKAKFQSGKAENGESNSKGDPKDVQVKVFGFTQANGSYGPIYAATAKSFSSDARASTLQRKSPNYQVQTPLPFKPQSRHSISKLSTSSFPSPSEKQISDSSPKKALPHAYENTDIQANKQCKQSSTSANQNSTVTDAIQAYVNTRFGTVDIPSNNEESPVNLISSLSKSNYSTHPNVEEGLAYVNAPPFAPPQSSKPKLANSYSGPGNGSSDAQEMHGFVASSPDEGFAKPAVSPKPKPVEEMRKKTPIKPKRSIRIKSTEGAGAPPSPSTIANKASISSALQKYQKKNIYNEIVMKNEEPPQLIVEAEYEGIPGRNVIPRSNSTVSLEKSSSSGRASTPPRLPARTVESQMLLNEGPPVLPTRTEQSYMTLEVPDEQQAYEAIDTNATSSSPASFHTETGRRPSTSSITATKGFAAKAKNMVEKTTNALSKVSASISKSNDEDSSGTSPSTVDNRTPTYAPGPVMYGGQDMSFGKRLMRKVKGGRKPR